MVALKTQRNEKIQPEAKELSRSNGNIINKLCTKRTETQPNSALTATSPVLASR